MAKFQLNPKTPLVLQGQRPERVRIGSISVFALVVIICLAVLAVLAFSTANASLVMSQRQATSISELYLDERAAQEFLAGVDDVLAGVRGKDANAEGESEIELVRDARGNVVYDENGYMVVNEKEPNDDAGRRANVADAGAAAVSSALEGLIESAREAADGKVDVSATVAGNKASADFTCENGRMLSIVITIRNNGTCRIDKWKMSAVQNEEQPEGQLLIID